MDRCKRNIPLVFGYLLVVALLFVPYESFNIETKQGIVTTRELDYWMNQGYQQPPPHFSFTPILIYRAIVARRRVVNYSYEDDLGRFLLLKKGPIIKYKVRLSFLFTELAIIILVGGFAYILFCVVSRK